MHVQPPFTWSGCLRHARCLLPDAWTPSPATLHDPTTPSTLRYDYEGVSSDDANKMIAHLETVIAAAKKGEGQATGRDGPLTGAHPPWDPATWVPGRVPVRLTHHGVVPASQPQHETPVGRTCGTTNQPTNPSLPPPAPP